MRHWWEVRDTGQCDDGDISFTVKHVVSFVRRIPELDVHSQPIYINRPNKKHSDRPRGLNLSIIGHPKPSFSHAVLQPLVQSGSPR